MPAIPAPHDGSGSTTAATPTKLNTALINVTWLGVSPNQCAPAARHRPTGRFTKRE